MPRGVYPRKKARKRFKLLQKSDNNKKALKALARKFRVAAKTLSAL